MTQRLTACLTSNPFLIAGLSDWPHDEGELSAACYERLTQAIHSENKLPPPDSIVLYGMIKVAQEEYGGDEGGYWPHLEQRLGIGKPLLTSQHSVLGEWFRDALKRLGYPYLELGQKNLGPILWHAGCPRHQLPKLIEFVVAQVSIYGDRSTEPDAVHALGLGDVAENWNPPLPQSLQRLFKSCPDGMDQVWSLLAGVVLDVRNGRLEEARASWTGLPGITFDDVIDSLPRIAVAKASCKSVRRPQLRYHADTGELRLWLADGESVDDWCIEGLTIHWQGRSGIVRPPLLENYSLTHKPSQQRWNEQLFDANRRTIWFGGRSGVLERANTIAICGLAAGPMYVLVNGRASAPFLDCRDRRPLEIECLRGSEAWTAWAVDIPLRQTRGKLETWNLTVDGNELSFPLSRLGCGNVTEDEPLHVGELADGSPIAIYDEPPRLVATASVPITVIRLCNVSADRMDSKPLLLIDGSVRIPDYGPGVYQLRHARGVGRTILEYAVIPGFACSQISTVDSQATVDVEAGSAGRFHADEIRRGSWRIAQPDSMSWLKVTWKWADERYSEIRFAWPVLAVRWRMITGQGSEVSEWSRDPVSLDRQQVARQQMRLEFETPSDENVSINGQSVPAAEFRRWKTGFRFEVRPDAYPTADAITIGIGGQEYDAAWLSERPVMSQFEAIVEGDRLVVVWDAVHLPTSTCLGIWDATDPVASITFVAFEPREHRGSWDLPIPNNLISIHQLAISVGVHSRLGFAVRFQPALAENGQPIVALADRSGTDDPWTKLVHSWVVALRFGEVPVAGVVTAIHRLGERTEWLSLRKFTLALDKLKTSLVRDRLRDDLSLCLQTAWPVAMKELIAAGDPSQIIADWLHVGVHPGWFHPREIFGSKTTDTGYPVHYFAALFALNDLTRTIEDRRDAAFDVWHFHSSRELFSPSAGLPIVRSTMNEAEHRSQGLRPDRTTAGGHEHCFDDITLGKSDDQTRFQTEVLGHDTYVTMIADARDQFPNSLQVELPRVSASRFHSSHTKTVKYSVTHYQAVWNDSKSRWQIDKKQWDNHKSCKVYRLCCDSTGPLVATPWTAAELVDQLALIEWLREHAAMVPATFAALPSEFDAFLFATPLGPVHRRVLLSPQPISQQLFGCTVSTPEYADMSAAGKWAWRIAWLDRCGHTQDANGKPIPNPAITDWVPYFLVLRKALMERGPFAELLTKCLAVAEYTRSILSGGLGPAFRFQCSKGSN